MLFFVFHSLNSVHEEIQKVKCSFYAVSDFVVLAYVALNLKGF